MNTDVRYVHTSADTGDRHNLGKSKIRKRIVRFKGRTLDVDAGHRAAQGRAIGKCRHEHVRNLIIRVLRTHWLHQMRQLEIRIPHRRQRGLALLGPEACRPPFPKPQGVIHDIDARRDHRPRLKRPELAGIHHQPVIPGNSLAHPFRQRAQAVKPVKFRCPQRHPRRALIHESPRRLDDRFIAPFMRFRNQAPLFAERAKPAVHRAGAAIDADGAPHPPFVADHNMRDIPGRTPKVGRFFRIRRKGQQAQHLIPRSGHTAQCPIFERVNERIGIHMYGSGKRLRCPATARGGWKRRSGGQEHLLRR